MNQDPQPSSGNDTGLTAGGRLNADQAKTLESVLEQNLLLASKRRDKAKHWEPQFSRYVQLKQEPLLLLAYKITGCWHAAGDAVQEAFIALHRQLFKKGLEGDNHSLAAWLTTTTTNNALGHLRKERARKTVPIDDVAEPEAPPQDCPLERHEAIDEARRRIEQLPEQQRRVFNLRYCDNWSYDRIAAELGISAATAERYYRRAVTSLKAQK